MHDHSHQSCCDWQVDDLLQEHGIPLTGEHASHVLAIEHTGLQLYPLDEGQEGLEVKPIVAAAFAPCSESDSDSSSCSEGAGHS